MADHIILWCRFTMKNTKEFKQSLESFLPFTKPELISICCFWLMQWSMNPISALCLYFFCHLIITAKKPLIFSLQSAWCRVDWFSNLSGNDDDDCIHIPGDNGDNHDHQKIIDHASNSDRNILDADHKFHQNYLYCHPRKLPTIVYFSQDVDNIFSDKCF